MKFSSFKNKHKGATVLVCGCGRSLNQLESLDLNCVIIGVNDVGRLLTPDYLVVLNSKSQFKGDRFQYVANSKAKAVFSQLDLGLRYAQLVKFNLDKYGGTEIDGKTGLPYTRNSPYVAACLAAYMGAKRIGLIGVDFTENHFFGQTGKHRLTRTLTNIDKEYEALMTALHNSEIELVNVSDESALTALPKASLESFLRQGQPAFAPATNVRNLVPGINAASQQQDMINSLIQVQIENHSGLLLKRVLDTLAETCSKLNYDVVRKVNSANPDPNTVRIVWNGRRYSNKRRMIFCEHGWLPRDSYQVSTRGINADSHVAGFQWNGQAPAEKVAQEVECFLEDLRRSQDFSREYMQTNGPAAKKLPKKFLLVPLQIEGDTNLVRHVEPQLRTMQAFINHVSYANPPWPIIFKQHPADERRNNRQMRLHVLRKQDQIRPHKIGNIHQILKSGNCVGVISLNSNVVHDTFIWGVPAIVLGNNIWPQKGVSPFLQGLPSDWNSLTEHLQKSEVQACRTQYIKHIIDQQWSVEDARDLDKVKILIEGALKTSAGFPRLRSRSSREIKRSKPETLVINVVAKNRGWLFEDLKTYFSLARIPNVKIIASDRPIHYADHWIVLRASELGSIPDLRRTLVQLHDNQEGVLYLPRGERQKVAECGAICMTHPRQKDILIRNGVELDKKQIMLRPIGYAGGFQPCDVISTGKFNVAWIGRPVYQNGIDIKRLDWFVQALQPFAGRADIKATLIGDRLDDCKDKIAKLGISVQCFTRRMLQHRDYPMVYKNVDCVVITSEDAAGPNCLYEALACGIPVVTTPCGWAESLIEDGVTGYVVHSPTEMGEAVEKIAAHRQTWFDRRYQIRSTVEDFTLDSWISENIFCAVKSDKQKYNPVISEVKQFAG